MTEFKFHVSSELTSLGALSFTLIISMCVNILSLSQIIGTRKMMASLFPLSNLLYVVFSSSIFMIAVYTKQHTYFASSMPIWTNYLIGGIAVLVLILAVLGYASYKRISSPLLMIYILFTAIASVVFLFTGIGFLVIGEHAMEVIQ